MKDNGIEENIGKRIVRKEGGEKKGRNESKGFNCMKNGVNIVWNIGRK